MRTLQGIPTERSLKLICVALLWAVSGSVACGPSSGDDTYDIVFTLTESPSALETLAFDVTFGNGSFAGVGGLVACSLEADDDDETIDSEINDDGALAISIDASDNVLEEGSDIVHCSLSSSTQPVADDFLIDVTAATDDEGVNMGAGELADIAVVVTSTDIVTTTTTAAASLTR